MTKQTKFQVQKSDLIFNQYLKDDLSIIMKYNTIFGIGEEFIMFIPTLLTFHKGEWSVFCYTSYIKATDMKTHNNSVIWDFQDTAKRVLNDYFNDFLEQYITMEISEQRRYKFNLKHWKPLSFMDKRKEKLIKILKIR